MRRPAFYVDPVTGELLCFPNVPEEIDAHSLMVLARKHWMMKAKRAKFGDL